MTCGTAGNQSAAFGSSVAAIRDAVSGAHAIHCMAVDGEFDSFCLGVRSGIDFVRTGAVETGAVEARVSGPDHSDFADWPGGWRTGDVADLFWVVSSDGNCV